MNGLHILAMELNLGLSIWLIATFGSPIAPVWYLIAAAVVSISVIWSLKETAFDDLA